MIYQVGLIPSQFYEVLSDKNYGRFRDLVAFAVFLILINSAVSSINMNQRDDNKPVLLQIIYLRAKTGVHIDAVCIHLKWVSSTGII